MRLNKKGMSQITVANPSKSDLKNMNDHFLYGTMRNVSDIWIWPARLLFKIDQTFIMHLLRGREEGSWGLILAHHEQILQKYFFAFTKKIGIKFLVAWNWCTAIPASLTVVRWMSLMASSHKSWHLATAKSLVDRVQVWPDNQIGWKYDLVVLA